MIGNPTHYILKVNCCCRIIPVKWHIDLKNCYVKVTLTKVVANIMYRVTYKTYAWSIIAASIIFFFLDFFFLWTAEQAENTMLTEDHLIMLLLGTCSKYLQFTQTRTTQH